MQLEATLRDGGVSIMHDFMARQYPQLRKVLADQIHFTRSFYFIVHEDYAKLERIRVVSNAIVEGMKAKISE